jgi:hypothetical protein
MTTNNENINSKEVIRPKKGELLKTFKADMKEAERLQREFLIKRKEWIAETYGRAYGNETDGRSKIVSKDIKKQLEWMIPSMTDPFLSSSEIIKCHPITYEDAESARQNELLLNTQFCRKFNRYNFIMKLARVLATEGSVVIQTGWDYEYEEVDVTMDKIVIDEFGNQQIIQIQDTETIVKRNQPTAIVCRNEDIFIDPTCKDNMDECQFVIHRYETNMSTLRSDPRYKNLDKLSKQDNSLYNDPLYTREDQTYFEFKDEPRKKFVVYEYWGNYDIDGDGKTEAIVCAWVGDTIIRLETNPYPDQKPPFIIAPFNPIPFQMFGEALAENIGDNQKIKTAITRGLIDNMARSNNGQIGMQRGMLDLHNKKKFLAGKNFEYNGPQIGIWEGSYNQIPGSAFNMLELMNNEIESQTGVKSFSGGINASSLGGTATGARGAMDATATRRLNLVRNMSENIIKPLMRKWMSYNSEFLEEEEVVRVTNSEFVPIRRDSLDGRLDIDISVTTSEDNVVKRQELTFLLQTLGPNEDPEIRRHLMADIYELMKMPEHAERIRNYESKPNPLQEQAQQLELENKELENDKLKAEIERLYSSSQENEMDVKFKEWKTEVEKAKARKLNSESDLKDLESLEKDYGFKEQYDADERAKDRQHQLNMALIQKELGGPDEQIGVGYMTTK